MGAPSQTSILETVENTMQGMHAGIPPTALSRQHVAYSVNLTHRGGKPRTRPVLVKRRLDFADGIETNATEKRFQGATYYSGFGNNPSVLVASIGGRLFRYRPKVTSLAVDEISVAGDLDNPNLPQVWFFQGEEFLVRNDGYSLPLFFDGSSTRRSKGPPGRELPAGTAGIYANSRIVMALPDRRSFIAGDLPYSNGHAGPYGGRESILQTNENAAILNGAAFAIPINAGPITAMFATAVPDTSLGQGNLQIGTRKGIFGVHLPLDANQWTTTQQPTSVVSLPSAGPTGPYAVAIVNADAWYRSRLGIQSFQIGRRDMGTWVQTALSSEVEPIISQDTDYLLNFASAIEFDNRLLTTCSPYVVSGRGTAHRGLIALDFYNISSLTTRSNPDYDGLWTGLPILQVVTGEFDGRDRCFVFALDTEDNICLYELLKDDAGDFDFNGAVNVPVESWLVTHSLFGLDIYPDRVKVPLKELECADVFLEQLLGTVEVEAKYRSDASPFWRDWKEFSLCAEACQTNDCTNSCPQQYQFATFRRLPDPADDCSPATGRKYRTGYNFQMRLQWTGRAALDKLLVWAKPIGEIKPGCPTSEECKVVQGFVDDPFTYSIAECNLAITTQPQSVAVNEGDPFSFSFAFSGGATPFTVKWFKNGVELSDGSGISGSSTTTLTIEAADEDSVGSYHATVTDSSTPTCSAQTTPAVAAVIPFGPEIIFNGGEPPAMSGTIVVVGSSYVTNSWGGVALNSAAIDPNSVLNDTEAGCAFSLHMVELQEAIDFYGWPVLEMATFWWFTPSTIGFQKQLYNKVASEVCDPNDPTGDWFAGPLSNFYQVATVLRIA